ncbi:hypothetical protein KKD88_03795 [Patescibacteria group bacterium]|nr:hypothetical protein [Patescibacteria group bacterium]
MNLLTPTKVLFIKLGEGGLYEKECIERRNILKIGYKEISHDLCVSGKWNEVKKEIAEKMRVSDGVITYHLTQLKYFYEENDHVLWITFFNNKLRWCFAERKVTLEKDGTRYRNVKGKWKCEDLKGNTLFLEDLSGRLLRTQGFRGTICRVAEFDYLIDKINSNEPKDVEETERAFNNLKEKLAVIIKKLQPKEFELLVDLIFRNAGWQRLGVIGKTMKTVDLAIGHPVTGERAIVQIKCQSSLAEYKRYEERFLGMTEYDKFFYIAHTPEPSLEKYRNKSENIKVYFAEKVSELAINSGLYDWILKIAG